MQEFHASPRKPQLTAEDDAGRAIVADLDEDLDANARIVAAFRAVLADVGRVANDRQYAIEQLERILLTGGRP